MCIGFAARAYIYAYRFKAMYDSCAEIKGPADRLLEDALRVLVAFWLMTGFVLPNTFPGQVSVCSLLPQIANEAAPTAVVLLICGSFLVVWLLYAHTTTKAATLLWWLTLVYATCCAVPAVVLRAHGPDGSSAWLLLSTLTAGLLFARVCGAGAGARILAALGTLQSCYTIYNYIFLMRASGTSSVVMRASGTFGHPTGVYTIMLFCLPLAFALAATDGIRLVKMVWALAAALMFAALVLTWYRGGLLAICVGLVWLCSRTTLSRRSALVLGMCLMLTLFVAVYVRNGGTSRTLRSDGTLQSRYVLWHEGWQVFREHWLTGVGVTRLRLPMHSTDDGIPESAIYPDAHNLLLQWLDEMGIGGGILLIGFVVCVSSTIKNSSLPIAEGVGAAWLCLFVAGMFDTPFGLGTKERAFSNALSGALLGMTLLLSHFKLPQRSTNAPFLQSVHAD